MASAAIDVSLLSQEEQDELLILMDEQEIVNALTDEERAAKIERDQLEASLADFAKSAWPILEPGVDLEWSWHYDYLCEYLTLVYLRKITRLIINISPRTGKSIFASVIFPAWVWAKQNTHNFACASYASNLSTEHSVKRRSLIESPWYQERWGDKVQFARDQNEKMKFKNTAMAQMLATSVGGTAVGLGGDTLILDDGMNPKQVGSDADTLMAHTWFDNTWRTRLNNLATGAFIIMEQRTGERDITGHCLEADDLLEREGKPREWTHIAIPLECENKPEKYKFPISGKIKVREVGDVLQPGRFPPSVVNALRIRRLVYSTQYQQHPSPLEGNMVKLKDIRYYGGRDPITQMLDPDLPVKFDMIITSADCTFKDEKTSDMVCVGTIGVRGPDKYVLCVVNKHLDLPATETEILRQQRTYRSSVVLIEDKANGSAIIKSAKRKISGVIAVDPEGGKMSRMQGTCGEWQGNNVYLSRNDEITQVVIEQVTKFPSAKYDDIVDMLTQALNYLARNTFIFGLTDWVKQKEAEEMAKRQQQKKNIPANALPDADAAIAKINNPDTIIKPEASQIVKPETDDMANGCPDCGGTFFQRIGSGSRCGNCGKQFHMRAAFSSTPDSGQVRK